MTPEVLMEERVIRYDTIGLDLVSLLRSLIEGILGADATQSSLFDTLSHWWGIYSIVALLLSVLFFIGFVYAKIKGGQLMAIVQHALHEAEAAWAHAYGGAVAKDARWTDIESHVTTDNPNDWRLAIIEADIMLEDVLEQAGYVGTTLGERLKAARNNPFQTIDDAWEAHIVRNKIAHSGSDFVLTQKKAKDTITQFGRVFQEFGTI
ncbi:MAG: hypothetical protein LR017_04230 [Candidatus Pacebacteria bacterium]|nr:hypothetical protein [Candidatus Paceibacterota bacterium]